MAATRLRTRHPLSTTYSFRVRSSALSGSVSGRKTRRTATLLGMTPRQLAFFVAVMIFVILAFRGCHRGELRIGTYNIRRLGGERTDTTRLAAST